MNFLVTGLNHRNAPVELREQVAITAEDLPDALAALRQWPGVRECMILSTCNRVELFTACGEQPPDLHGFLAQRFPVNAQDLRAHLYQFRDAEAVRHLFRVGASLDSMVVGEPQILGQVKEAYAAARSAGVVGSELERLLQSTFSVAKRVRTDTAIGSTSVSIASIAVDLALKIFGSLAGKKVLLVGAGKMGELAARHLLAQGAGSIMVSNRTLARAERLAQMFGGQVMPFEQLLERADQADILITSTGSHEFVFRREDGVRMLRRRRGRPMCFIDIAVPRDVDPAMNRVDGVFLYDIDDLQNVAAANLADRSREAASAERMVQNEVEQFARRAHVVDAVPTLRALRGHAEALRQAELRRAGRLESFTAEQRETVEALTRGLMNKFLHAPTQALRAAAQDGDDERLLLLRQVFQLAESGEAVDGVPAPGASGGLHGAQALDTAAARETVREDSDSEGKPGQPVYAAKHTAGESVLKLQPGEHQAGAAPDKLLEAAELELPGIRGEGRS
ncbi:glutamyl-tRNA reductase [Acidipila sp. EB88]|uniref:glutamyl-tRNA reductase n=1 Tax=Acidipila sp. EB88 TaxID=2305226 RepID=UPI000F5DE5C4|nr:glutamyl-tRNA reductase [Acidipila sp. EB88]RRA49443.1 glutamyl-tRNA reductase [Acidipila sp. EB88]